MNLVLIWTKEYENAELQNISPETLSDIYLFLEELKRQESVDIDDIHRKIFSMYGVFLRWILDDIKLLRRLKIVAFIIAHNEVPKNLLPEEAVFADAFRKIIETTRREKEIIGDPLELIRVEKRVDKKIKRQPVIVQTEIRSLVGMDGLVYRGLRKGTIANIPTKNYELLIGRGAQIKELS